MQLVRITFLFAADNPALAPVRAGCFVLDAIERDHASDTPMLVESVLVRSDVPSAGCWTTGQGQTRLSTDWEAENAVTRLRRVGAAELVHQLVQAAAVDPGSEISIEGLLPDRLNMRVPKPR
jgi:hypothetical protein